MSKTKSDRFSRLSPAAVYDTRLSAECVRVLSAIAVHVNKQGEGYPSARMLGKRLGCSERSVQHHVKALKAAGYIEVFWRRLTGGKLAGQVVRWYRLKYPDWEDPAEDQDETQAACGSETQAACGSSDLTKRNLDADETQLDRSRNASGLHPMNSPPLNSPSEQPSREHAAEEDLSGGDSASQFMGGQPRPLGDPPTQEPKQKKARGTRLADEAVLSDAWRAIAQERRADLDADRVFESFKRHFTGPDCGKPVKKDWTRAWINWIERERHGQPGRENRGLAAAAFAGAAEALGRTGRR